MMITTPTQVYSNRYTTFPLHKEFLDLLLRVSVTGRHTVFVHNTTVSTPEITLTVMTKRHFPYPPADE